VQNGGDLNNLNSQQVADALAFYTGFYNPTGNNVRVWDGTFDNSVLAFARGEVAMIFGPSWMMHDIWEINPNLEIGVAPMPQLNEQQPVGIATYWVEGVNANSPRQDAAWRLLEFLSRPDILEKMYADQMRLRHFGEMYPRPAMADLLAHDPRLQPYLAQAPFAVANPFAGRTWDEGLNDARIRAMATAVNAFRAGNTGERVLNNLQNQVNAARNTYEVR
jgi:ABC-type glycerol-3-phosphate transport system substrate-binding protein